MLDEISFEYCRTNFPSLSTYQAAQISDILPDPDHVLPVDYGS